MIRRTRTRRGPYAVARPSVVPSIIRSLILLAIVGGILYLLGSWILWLFGSGNAEQRAPITMTVEQGNVNIALDGGLLQRAEDSLKLYGGDRVTTGNNGYVRFTAFEDTFMRLDEASDLTIEESNQGTEESEITLRLDDGALFIDTPETREGDVAVLRAVHSGNFTVLIPADTEMIIDESKMMVFQAEGAGVSFTLDGMTEEYTLGEGQQIVFPSGSIEGDVYSYRSAIDPLAVQRSFVTDSRALAGGSTAEVGDELLEVVSPQQNARITTATVEVEGSVAASVQKVRINGYDAAITTDRTFTQEITVDEDEMTLRIEALDEAGIVVAQTTRSITKAEVSSSVNAPTITAPATSGQTYRTSAAEVTISGNAPSTAAGIRVNDYRLQLFKAGDTTWSYIASTELGNLATGTNEFNVYSIDEDGNVSEPATITIIVGAGQSGVVDDADTDEPEPTQVSEDSLPQNAPLEAGTLQVTGPAAGTSFTVTGTGSEFLIEGSTSAATASVWVNGYRLQLFKAGSTYWNYIASAALNTLKRGTNTYVINARNENGQILDTVTYTIEY